MSSCPDRGRTRIGHEGDASEERRLPAMPLAANQAEWWHHPPTIPDELPGCNLANRTAMAIPCFTKPVPELIDQYAKAFEKVWAHRSELKSA